MFGQSRSVSGGQSSTCACRFEQLFLRVDGVGKDDFEEEPTDVRSDEDRHSIERKTRRRDLGCEHSGRLLPFSIRMIRIGIDRSRKH